MRFSQSVAGLPALTAGYRPPADGQVKLNQNESPIGLAPEEWAELLPELGAVQLHRYPDPQHAALTEVIARSAGVAADMVLAGNGANSLLELLIRATCDAGDQVLTVAPTYHLYDRFAAMNRAELVKVGWREGFGFPRHALLQAIEPRTRMVLVCRPNNPTGHLFPPQEVLALADSFAGFVVVDEAYYDFCRDTLVSHLGTVTNLVLVRTLSKAYAAAGLRLGYLLASAPIVRAVRTLQLPYAVNAVSEVIAGFLLSRPEMMERRRSAIIADRADLHRRLAELDGLRVFPSSTNFLLVRTPYSVDRLDRYLQARHIFIRNLKWDDRHARISVGTPTDHARLVDSLKGFAATASGGDPETPGDAVPR